MRTNVKVTLQMKGNYPCIYSGIVYFRNIRTGTEVLIQAPNDLLAATYGVNSIVLDSGSACMAFPDNFAEKLSVKRPTKGEERYYIFSGVGGASIGFVSLDLIMVGVRDDKSKLEWPVLPFFLTRFAPSITCEGKLLSQEELQPYTGEVVDFICPPFEYHNDYMVEVRSPDVLFPPLKRRLKLEVNTGLDMDYILIGRDWQRWFDILFKEGEMIIFGR